MRLTPVIMQNNIKIVIPTRLVFASQVSLQGNVYNNVIIRMNIEYFRCLKNGRGASEAVKILFPPKGEFQNAKMPQKEAAFSEMLLCQIAKCCLHLLG